MCKVKANDKFKRTSVYTVKYKARRVSSFVETFLIFSSCSRPKSGKNSLFSFYFLPFDNRYVCVSHTHEERVCILSCSQKMRTKRKKYQQMSFASLFICCTWKINLFLKISTHTPTDWHCKRIRFFRKQMNDGKSQKKWRNN